MDFVVELHSANYLAAVEMRSTGESIRIIDYEPNLRGTLLEQRARFKASRGLVRRKFLSEPRGHRNMRGESPSSDMEFMISVIVLEIPTRYA